MKMNASPLMIIASLYPDMRSERTIIVIHHPEMFDEMNLLNLDGSDIWLLEVKRWTVAPLIRMA